MQWMMYYKPEPHITRAMMSMLYVCERPTGGRVNWWTGVQVNIRTGLCPPEKICAENPSPACNRCFFGVPLTRSRASRILLLMSYPLTDYIPLAAAVLALLAAAGVWLYLFREND